MIALRKPQAPDTMTGGHRWDFMEKLLTSGIDLSSDAKLLLYVLVTHHGDERRVNPGLRRLAEMSSMSNGRCMAARDELITAGLITGPFKICVKIGHKGTSKGRGIGLS